MIARSLRKEGVLSFRIIPHAEFQFPALAAIFVDAPEFEDAEFGEFRLEHYRDKIIVGIGG